MVFTAEVLPKRERFKRQKKAEYPFLSMRDNPGTGFIIPAERQDLFGHCRTMASIFNAKHGTVIQCNKQEDGSLRVWNERTVMKPEVDLVPILQESIQAVEAAKEDSQAPSKEQFQDYLQTMQAGMSITLQHEYAHRFAEFEMWTNELEGFDTEVKYNPPTLKISRKGNEE